MASSSAASSSSNLSAIFPNSSSFNSQITHLFPIPSSYFNKNYRKNTLKFSSLSCSAAKQQTGPVKKRTSPNNTKKKKKPISNFESDVGDIDVEVEEKGLQSSEPYHPLPLPKPPAGFVLDEQGRVLMASNKRIATIVDSTNNFPLECVIRRVFKSTRGDECLLLCPVDMPVQILKSTNVEGWSAVSDEEVEAILPTAAYALAKIHMHLVYSGLLHFSDDGDDVDGLPSEGIEITCFHMDGSHYMIYTPSDPLLFVAVKGKDGLLQIADDEEEAALLESLLGER
ncbi:hypothetical protein H5410_020594 [Solanum commersonii]|uniref:Uncharacterized protein n=1 Tax=Solanum commersonii TaxID=4109 RepID=A0A9J5Z8W2_SOLCO|nr:hypothetical protein H5410_020594 [Solanum commersonii]